MPQTHLLDLFLLLAPSRNLLAQETTTVSIWDRWGWTVCVAVTVETPVMMQSGRLVMGLSEQCAKPANPPEGFSPGNVWALILSNWLQMLRHREREGKWQMERPSLQLSFQPSVCSANYTKKLSRNIKTWENVLSGPKQRSAGGVNTNKNTCTYMLYRYRYAWTQWHAEWLHLITQLFTSGFCGLNDCTMVEGQSVFMQLRRAKLIIKKRSLESNLLRVELKHCSACVRVYKKDRAMGIGSWFQMIYLHFFLSETPCHLVCFRREGEENLWKAREVFHWSRNPDISWNVQELDSTQGKLVVPVRDYQGILKRRMCLTTWFLSLNRKQYSESRYKYRWKRFDIDKRKVWQGHVGNPGVDMSGIYSTWQV